MKKASYLSIACLLFFGCNSNQVTPPPSLPPSLPDKPQPHKDISKELPIAPVAVEPISVEPIAKPKSTTVPLRGIVIINEASLLKKMHLEKIEGIHTEGISLPGSTVEFKKRLEPFLSQKEINKDTLLLIKNTILNYYNDHQQSMIVVEIPKQEITSGVVTFVIMNAKFEKIAYIGNRWFSQKKVQKALDLQSGETIDQDALLNNLAWLNQNPFHYTEAILSPGEKKGQTDIDILTKDRFPLRFYVGGDNTGVESTGRSRYYAGVTWGNAFFVDDLLTYQFSTNSTYNKFHSHSLSYQSFLPWQHIFTLYGGYAKIHPDITDFDSTGKEAQASFRYKVPFKPLYTQFQHQFYFGFDYKYVTSDLFFIAEIDAPETVANKRVNITQEMLGYQLDWTPNKHQLTFCLELFGSPAEWIPHQSHHNYNAFRQHATPRYFYGTLALGEIYTFATKDSISALIRAQGSTNPLIPSEQFKLGGYNTVRGYEESVFVSDNGICANFELRARPLHLFKKAKDELTFLAFMDYGWGYNYHAFDGITKTASLWGTGPGARYNINPYFNARVDYGFKLHHVGFDDNKLGMWHISVTASY